jgi:hypothetical protein
MFDIFTEGRALALVLLTGAVLAFRVLDPVFSRYRQGRNR